MTEKAPKKNTAGRSPIHDAGWYVPGLLRMHAASVSLMRESSECSISSELKVESVLKTNNKIIVQKFRVQFTHACIAESADRIERAGPYPRG